MHWKQYPPGGPSRELEARKLRVTTQGTTQSSRSRMYGAWKPFKRMAGSTGLEPAASAVTGQRSNQLNYDPAFVCFGLAETLVTTGDSTHSTVSPVSSTSTTYNPFRRFMDSMDSKQNRPTWLGLTRASRSQPNLLDCNRFRLGARESCSSCFLLLNRPAAASSGASYLAFRNGRSSIRSRRRSRRPPEIPRLLLSIPVQTMPVVPQNWAPW